MSEEEKKAPVKAIGEAGVPAKSGKQVPAKHFPANHVPAVHVLSTIDVLMDNLRRNHIKKIAYPWDRVSLKPAISVRKATIAISTPRRPKFPSTL
jgi:hypothetical protein